MALSWPLAVDQFFDMLPIKRVTFKLGRSSTFSETGGGELIDHKIGARLWQGEIQLDKDFHRVWAAIEARLALLEEPGASLLVRDIRLPGPIADPDGSLLGANAVKINTLDANNREFSLKGLPDGYVISQGDLLGFSYGSNPVRHAFHRVVTGAVAAIGGVTPLIEVTPFIRQGVKTLAPVTLVAPVCKAKIVTAEYGASRATISQGGTLSWMQTLR